MKYLIIKLAQFKQWILSIVIKRIKKIKNLDECVEKNYSYAEHINKCIENNQKYVLYRFVYEIEKIFMQEICLCEILLLSL